MKLLLLLALALCQSVYGQFGSSRSCDIRRLAQAVQTKEQCFKQMEDLMKEGMRAIQRSDPTCNQGMVEACDKCSQPSEEFNKNNDLNAQGVMECCFSDRLGGFGGSNRQCEFMSKPNIMEMWDKKGGKGGKHGGGRGRGPPGRGPPGMMDEDDMKNMMTLSGMAMKSLGHMGKGICKKMKFCKNEERFVNSRAMPTAKEYGDRLTAKLFECYAPMMEVATNCTDLQPSDMECMMKGWGWNMHFKKMCIMACSPMALSPFCNMAIQGASATPSANNGNDFFSPFNTFNGR